MRVQSRLLVLEELTEFPIKVVDLFVARFIEIAVQHFLVDEWLQTLCNLRKLETFILYYKRLLGLLCNWHPVPVLRGGNLSLIFTDV